jgi:hypothetical protein
VDRTTCSLRSTFPSRVISHPSGTSSCPSSSCERGVASHRSQSAIFTTAFRGSIDSCR